MRFEIDLPHAPFVPGFFMENILWIGILLSVAVGYVFLRFTTRKMKLRGEARLKEESPLTGPGPSSHPANKSLKPAVRQTWRRRSELV